MRNLIAVLIVALIAGVAIRLYFRGQASSGGPGSAALDPINDVSVKNDLVQIAQAERAYWAEHGAYASLDELVSSGAVTAAKLGRANYTYSIESKADGFTVLARCKDPKIQPCPEYSADQTMRVHRGGAKEP
jgi:hypothetical protein